MHVTVFCLDVKVIISSYFKDLEHLYTDCVVYFITKALWKNSATVVAVNKLINIITIFFGI